MSEPKKNSISTTCFKVSATGFVLFVAVVIVTVITRSIEVWQVALFLLAITGVAVLIGVIAQIWEAE